MAFLFNREGADVVEEALVKHRGEVLAHAFNATEVFYQLHRRGALASWLARTPGAQNPTEPDKPNLGGAELRDPQVFDAVAGESVARKGITNLEAAGVQWIETISRAAWEDAACLKSQWRRVSLADCFGLSLARERNCAFLTGDHHELDALDAAKVALVEWIR